MYLFFDTETTGIPKNYKAPASDLKNWPRLVQLAWLATDDTGIEIRSAERIVKPAISLSQRMRRKFTASPPTLRGNGVRISKRFSKTSLKISKPRKF